MYILLVLLVIAVFVGLYYMFSKIAYNLFFKQFIYSKTFSNISGYLIFKIFLVGFMTGYIGEHDPMVLWIPVFIEVAAVFLIFLWIVNKNSKSSIKALCVYLGYVLLYTLYSVIIRILTYSKDITMILAALSYLLLVISMLVFIFYTLYKECKKSIQIKLLRLKYQVL